jgi:hypothetical protein
MMSLGRKTHDMSFAKHTSLREDVGVGAGAFKFDDCLATTAGESLFWGGGTTRPFGQVAMSTSLVV